MPDVRVCDCFIFLLWEIRLYLICIIRKDKHEKGNKHLNLWRFFQMINCVALSLSIVNEMGNRRDVFFV